MLLFPRDTTGTGGAIIVVALGILALKAAFWGGIGYLIYLGIKALS